MSKLYKEVKAGDPILAEDWNSIQRRIHEHIVTHTHTGVGESGATLDINIAALAADASLDVRKLGTREGLVVGPASQPLLVVNPAATNKEGNYQVNVAGTLRADQVRTGRLDGITDLAVGSLTVTGGATVGAPADGKGMAAPSNGLAVNGPGRFAGPVTAPGLLGDPGQPSLDIINAGGAERKIRVQADGGTEVGGGLTIRGNTTVKDGLLVESAATLKGSLAVEGDVTIGARGQRSQLEVQGTVRAGKFEGEGAFVRGMIVMWSGASNAVPAGWALCDGVTGTPDLRDRFIVGAGGNHRAGFAGEGAVHTHTVSGMAAAGNTGEAGAHSHNMPPEWIDQAAMTGGTGPFGASFATVFTGGNVRGARTTPATAHVHNYSISFGPSETGPAGGTVEPRWYALCLIMKL